MSEQIKKALNFDSLATVEEIFPRDSEAATGLGLLLHIENGQRKKELLKATKDTHYSCKWIEFKEIIIDLGFEIQFCDPFTGRDFGEKEVQEECLLAFDAKRCALLWADSYGKSVNSGNVYFQSQMSDEFNWPQHASGGPVFGNNSGYVCLSFDVREGLRYNLSQVPNFQNPWVPHDRFMWLLTYMDTKVEGYDYYAITNSRLDRLSPEIKRAIAYGT